MSFQSVNLAQDVTRPHRCDLLQHVASSGPREGIGHGLLEPMGMRGDAVLHDAASSWLSGGTDSDAETQRRALTACTTRADLVRPGSRHRTNCVTCAGCAGVICSGSRRKLLKCAILVQTLHAHA